MEDCDGEASDQSEFNSDAEEVEFGLYASLYFEPNPDFLPVKNIKSIKNGNQTKNIDAESISDLPHKIDSQMEKVIVDTIVDKELNLNIQKEDNLDKDIVESNYTISAVETQSSRKDFDDEVNNEIGLNENIRSQSKEKNENSGSEHNNNIDAQNQIKFGPGDNAEYEKRVRQSSICSVDSIAGNTKLDSLYTINISSSDEDVYQEELDSKLAINNIILKENKEKKKGITSINKRKRDIKESASSGSDDNEDSKCHIMSIAVKKKKIEKGSKVIYNENDSSESDSDIHVLPPSPKQFETLEVSSETESESHKQIIKNIEQNVPKEVNKSDLGSVKSTAQLLKSKKLKPQSSEIPKKGLLLSIDDYSNKTKSKKQKKGKEKKNSKDCIIISEDSDDSLDILEISKGTDLVMNLGGGLDSFIERPDANKTKEKKKKKKKSKKGDGFSNVDYTQGRQLTTKIPSCKKWTSEMATFYDSDISEDLEVEDIHAQQSDSPLLWNIIPRDYPVRGRRRYFNQEARCKRCRQFGHEEKDCPRVPRCHLCSKTDHVVRYQCPNNCCFRCGGEPHAFCQNTLNTTICELCGWPGHNTNLCPDLWRRFHITTSGKDPQPPVLLNSTLRPRSEAYCYCCARRGHFGHECPDRHQIRSCVPVAQSVVSYAPPMLQREGERVINLVGCEGPPDEAAYNPVTKIKIQMKDGGRIVGKSGVIVKDIERRTGAKVNIATKKGKQMVCVYGNTEAREAAKNLIEVLLEKKAPDGYESFVMHVARINNSPSVLNILKKSTGSLGKKSPNISKTELNKEDMYQKNQLIKISQERNLFNETPRKRLKEDESLKEDFLSLNKIPRRIIKEDESLKEDFLSLNKIPRRRLDESLKEDFVSLDNAPRKRLKEDDSLKEDFLSLNTKSKLFTVREDQKSPSSNLRINEKPHENFWNLKTLKKSVEQSCQLSQDASLQKDFLSLKTPRRIRKNYDDLQILESPIDSIEDKSRKVNNDIRWNDYFIEDPVDGPSNRENELQKATRLAMEEEIDNLGIQVTFMSRLRQNLPRNKRLLLEQSKDLLARIDSMDYDIPSLVNKIKKNRKIFTQSNPAFQQKKWLKKNLQMVSMVVIGQERLGSGVNLRRTLDCLLKEVKVNKGKAPQQFVSEISETLKQICDPSVTKIDEILRLAKTYMQRYPQGKSDISAYDMSSKKDYKKQNEVSKEPKKKKVTEKLKSKKVKSPRRFIKINKNVAKDFGAKSSKSIDLNRKPKKNKKKKLKIRTKEGKRNWNAVFNNS